MGPRTAVFWQTIVVWLLFLASMATLLFNGLVAYPLTGREQSVRNELREATLKLAHEAEPAAEHLALNTRPLPQDVDLRLEQLTNQVLVDRRGVEGGFFVNHERDEFAGYSYPTGPEGGPPDRGGLRQKRRDPPPREEPYIRLQAKQSASQGEGIVITQSIDVGPSRVVVATAPVGKVRPAPLVVWMMYRVTGPETQRAQVSRYQLSTLLALGGIGIALGLTWNLQRTLRRERADREQLRDELRRSEHLASLGVLLAKVAHEVRNPLAGIRSTAQLWERLPDESRTPQSLKAVIEAVDRLDALVSQLLYFSRSENTGRESVELNTVVAEVCELLKAKAVEHNVRLDVDLDPQLPRIRGSAAGLRQVILNLATNALQAMPHSGRLSCRTRSMVADRTVELEIADTGAGIDPSIRARLFEPFFTTRPNGTGLGLSLCREIVLQHDGRIELEPRVPQGTVCRVVLPTEEQHEQRKHEHRS